LDLLPLDELRPVWDLKIRRPFAAWDVVSVFNWTDEPARLRLTFAQLGLDAAKEYLLYEFWSRKLLGAGKGAVDLPLEPRSNLLLAVHPRLERPQLLSTDRHVSQGGVELADMTWKAAGELTCTFNMVAGDALTAYFHVPPKFALVAASAEGATVETAPAAASPLLAVTLRRASSGRAVLRLKFH
jgi:hypothetical protein